MRILYVENHPRFVRAVGQFLASHEVVVVPSLAMAREVLAKEHFDAILLDYDLNDGKGDELVSEIANQSRRPILIAVSAHQGGNEALIAAGADAVCSKMQFSTIEELLSRLTDS